MRTLPIICIAMLAFTSACEIMPRNTLKDCRAQCLESNNPKACYDFCDCIHKNCQPLDSCLANYEKAPVQVHKEYKVK